MEASLKSLMMQKTEVSNHHRQIKELTTALDSEVNTRTNDV